MAKYVFVTGGVVSSLGKGIAAASLAAILESRGIRVTNIKLDPYINSAGEIKTKPTQHSVKELREIGIQPDALLCRTDRPVPEDEKRKIALFCNVQKEAVISAWDVDSIYKIPTMLHNQMLDEIVC